MDDYCLFIFSLFMKSKHPSGQSKQHAVNQTGSCRMLTLLMVFPVNFEPYRTATNNIMATIGHIVAAKAIVTFYK